MNYITLAVAEQIPSQSSATAINFLAFPNIAVRFVTYDEASILQCYYQHEPKVLLMVTNLIDSTTTNIARAIKESYPTTHIIVLSAMLAGGANSLYKAIQAGITGFLPIDTPAEKLANAIQDILRGGVVFDPLMAARVVHLLRYDLVPISSPGIIPEQAQLTARERQVFELLMQGLGTRQISGQLFIVEKTVRKHLENIYRKLKVSGSREAMAKAWSNS